MCNGCIYLKYKELAGNNGGGTLTTIALLTLQLGYIKDKFSCKLLTIINEVKLIETQLIKFAFQSIPFQ